MTDAELAILSIIAEAPKAGLDIQDVIEERNLRLWTLIGVESIYYVIEKLHKQGLIENIDENPSNDPKVRLYRITSAGIGLLQTSVTDLLSSPQFVLHGLSLGLANLTVLQSIQIVNALNDYRSSLRLRHEDLQTQLQSLDEANTPFHIQSMFEYQILMLKTELDWLSQWIPKLQKHLPDDESSQLLEFDETASPRMQQVVMPNDPDSFHKQRTIPHGIPHEVADDVEFPPPPERRQKKSLPKTEISRPTRPQTQGSTDHNEEKSSSDDT